MNVQALSNVDLSNAVSVAVARKTLDTQQFQGQAMVQMIRDAAKAGASPSGSEAEFGRGARLDIHA